ncbi:Alkyl hydroperoxide reductase C [Buchnera aphidicola (Anoecia corni)]|uniref:Thioredoxin peroxidase n=1 Tax=Buchnera aphidicola (Anoecia corni) TaxID=2994477 RepID=A0AAT9IG26_9GAMM
MSLVTLPAPDFTASAILKNGDIVNNFNLKKFVNNKYSIIFFWPMDFTFVCPSELISLDNAYSHFEKRKVQIIGISIDSVFVHNAWRNTDRQNGGIGPVKYVMVSDIKRKIQKLYGIEHPILGVALRASFIIDKHGIIRHQVVNDLPFGRNTQEFLRIIDAIEHTEKVGEVCPANWKKGKEGMTPSSLGVKTFLTKHSNSL